MFSVSRTQYTRLLGSTGHGVSPVNYSDSEVTRPTYKDKADNKDKADIFSRQFWSVYTREKACDIPPKGPSPYPVIEVNFSARVLKECSAEIAQVLACIFN